MGHNSENTFIDLGSNSKNSGIHGQHQTWAAQQKIKLLLQQQNLGMKFFELESMKHDCQIVSENTIMMEKKCKPK